MSQPSSPNMTVGTVHARKPIGAIQPKPTPKAKPKKTARKGK